MNSPLVLSGVDSVLLEPLQELSGVGHPHRPTDNLSNAGHEQIARLGVILVSDNLEHVEAWRRCETPEISQCLEGERAGKSRDATKEDSLFCAAGNPVMNMGTPRMSVIFLSAASAISSPTTWGRISLVSSSSQSISCSTSQAMAAL